MPVIYTDELTPTAVAAMPQSTVRQIYNSLDCGVTIEVREALGRITNNAPNVIYDFERALQAPVLEMSQRGFLIDQYERQKAITQLRTNIAHLDRWLQEMAVAVWGRGLNPRSPKQLIDFFYHAMKLPEQWKNDKGTKRLSTDREALEKLELYFYARPIISTILEIRNLGKKLSVLETEIDPDGRMRTSYNIAGTETGRWSSSSNAFGTGTNLQNITAELRRIFIADPGHKLCGIDLEQAESREVGGLCGTLFGDWSYLDACYAGDLHTLVCKMVWRDLPWTGDAKADRALADANFYRAYSRRDLAKKLGHGCLTSDHEVLTKSGWVKISDQPQEILVWSEEKSYFSPVHHWTAHDYSGEMVHVEGNSLSLSMTEDHRVLYFTDDRCPIREAPAGKFPKVGKIPLGANFVGGDYEITPEFARLVAAYQCDGYLYPNGTLSFHFHKERKFQRLTKLCADANMEMTRNGTKAYVKNFGLIWPKAAGAYLLLWPQSALQAYINEHKFWDGHISETAQCLFSKDRSHLEWLQTIGRLVGIGGFLQKPRVSGFGTEIHKLQQNGRKYASIASLKVLREFASCKVYCPTVETGAFYVRRNGKISVTGNSNYYGQPFTMSRHAKIQVKLAEEFQHAYFTAFPGIPKWHRWTAQQLQQNCALTTPWGRHRHFFGRPNDDATLREAIAFVPQSATGDRMNLGLYRIWRAMRPTVQLIAQVHDAVYFQFPEGADEQEIVREALRLIEIETDLGARKLIVPGEAKTGWNWGNYDPTTNPEGLRKLKGKDDRQRAGVLDRIR